MILLIKLLLAHFVGDFLLQPTSWVAERESKKARSPKLYIHILLHGLLILLVLWEIKYWLLALILMIVHGIVDFTKIYAQNEKNRTTWFLLDQLLHILSIFVVWTVFFHPDFNFRSLLANETLWIYATALVFIVFVAGIGIQVLLSKWSNSLNDSNEASLNNAGKYIGILERLFVFTFVVTGNWGAIGFLLAAKSVFRFGDLKESKDRKLTEYILIGTLLSFGVAVAVGLVVLKLIEL